jgi:hypothetical protein
VAASGAGFEFRVSGLGFREMDRWRRRGRVQEEERLYLHLKEDRSPSYHAAPACACKEEVEMR